ncbi:MAG: hypothetical protein JRS35_23780 [Deltaproteobacteria bacterium]|nr:hypothetical protein [Deltaproteobacteria bacterium]
MAERAQARPVLGALAAALPSRRRSAPFTIAETTDHDGAKQAFTISEMRMWGSPKRINPARPNA